MLDSRKTKKQLIAELEIARQRIAEQETRAFSAGQAEEYKLLKFIFEYKPLGIVFQDVAGTIILSNPQADEILGLSEGQILGRKSVDPRWKAKKEDGSEFSGLEHPAMVALATGKPVENVVMRVHNPKLDMERWITINATPMFEGNDPVPRFVAATFLDITERKLAEEALRKSERRLQFALQASNTGAWELNLVDHTAHRTLIHDRIFGYDELLPSWTYEQFLDHVLPEDRPEVDRRFQEARASQSRWDIECRIRRADGEIRWIWASGIHEEISKGRPTRIAGIVQDITERRQAEEALRESEERFRIIVNSIPQLCWMANADGWIFWYNQRWYDYTGTTPKEMEGWGWQSVHDPDYLPEVVEQWKASLATGKTFDLEFPIRGSDGVYHPFLTRGIPICDQDGRIVRWCGTNTDISERKLIEEQLHAAKEEAEQANRAKSQFLANMSHEIRTPMNGILGMTHLALKRELPEDVRGFLQLVQQSGQSLLAIINDILDFSKIEAGMVTIKNQPFNLGGVLESALRLMKTIAGDKGLALHFSIDPGVPENVKGDSGRLRQILTNIVGNAIKFSFKGSVSVTVSPVETVSQQRHRLLFVVRDEGIGIPQDKIQSIFEDFEQISSSAHVKYGGTGLGLSISKALVEMMGGTIWVESELDKGSTFSFEIELGRFEEGGIPPQPPAPQSQNVMPPLKILLAEDNEVNRLFACHLLQSMGHQVEAVENGLQAIEKLRVETFGLVLMDALMPEMDGEQATKVIRSGQAGDPDIPIVALTAYALQGDRERFLAAGMDDYISKPIEIEELNRVLERLANRN